MLPCCLSPPLLWIAGLSPSLSSLWFFRGFLLLFVVLYVFVGIGRIGQSAPAMARCRNAAAGSNAPDTIIALTLFEKIAACAKAQPALDSGYGTNVHSWRSPRHSLEVYATIYTGYGRRRSH